MPAPTVIDAINAALGTQSSGAPDPNAAAAAEGDGGEETPAAAEDDAGTSDTGTEEEAEELGEEGEEALEAEETEEGEEEEVASEAEEKGERNADGTFKKKGEEKPAKKEPDAVNDPIPKDLKRETRDRMHSLVETAKSLTVERDRVKADFGLFVNGLQGAGVTPEQYGETLSFLSMFNSGDPVQQEKALELIDGMADRLATLLGKDRAVSDPLKAHADLQQAVQQGRLTKDYAAEIARTRNSQGFRRELSQSASNQNQQAQAQQQELHQARTELHTLEETLRKTDPSYERKKGMIVPALKAVFKDIPPKLWKDRFLEAYKAVNVGAAPAARRPVKAGQQPMRAGKNPAGGQSRAAASPMDAMNAALGSVK